MNHATYLGFRPVTVTFDKNAGIEQIQVLNSWKFGQLFYIFNENDEIETNMPSEASESALINPRPLSNFNMESQPCTIARASATGLDSIPDPRTSGIGSLDSGKWRLKYVLNVVSWTVLKHVKTLYERSLDLLWRLFQKLGHWFCKQCNACGHVRQHFGRTVNPITYWADHLPRGFMAVHRSVAKGLNF